MRSFGLPISTYLEESHNMNKSSKTNQEQTLISFGGQKKSLRVTRSDVNIEGGYKEACREFQTYQH